MTDQPGPDPEQIGTLEQDRLRREQLEREGKTPPEDIEAAEIAKRLKTTVDPRRGRNR